VLIDFEADHREGSYLPSMSLLVCRTNGQPVGHEVTGPPRGIAQNRHRRNSSSRPSVTEVGVGRAPELPTWRPDRGILNRLIIYFCRRSGSGLVGVMQAIKICTRLVTSRLVNSRDTCALTVASLRNSAAPTSALEAPDPIATAT